MDIHAPEGPTRSFKEFSIHILIVTIGILIALGLDGIRATVHEHNLLVETRDAFGTELGEDRKNLVNETANVQETSDRLDSILHDFADLVKSSDQLKQRVDDLHPSFYGFRGTGWGAASSSGVVAYMRPEEANKFAEVYSDIDDYKPLSRQAILDWTAEKSFFDSRQSFSPQDAVEGEQRLRALQIDLHGMKFVDQEFLRDMNAAVGSQ